jgi:hypothetical protein
MLTPTCSPVRLVSDSTLSRLDHATKLVTETRELWVLKVYPDAAEAGGSYRWVGRERAPQRSSTPDLERAREEGDRRARGRLRRYAAANGLSRLITCTYRGEGCHEPRQLRRDVGAFVRRLRGGVGHGGIPYAWVPEWHKSGHGLHVHLGVGEYIEKGLIERTWGHGFVDVRLLGKRGEGSDLEEARGAAGYLAKYIGKEVGAGAEQGLHRYEVAQGFQPAWVDFAGRTLEEAFDQATAYMGAKPVEVWRPDGDWDGPPVVWAKWSAARREQDGR